MTTLLVLTAGQSDVQLVVDGVRRELSRDRCAVLHDELERRGYALVDAPIRKELSSDTLADEELDLCTPKLDAVLREVLPDAALVLETRREPSAAPGDPRLAGTVLEARLKAKGVRTVHRHSYLGDRERLEDREVPRDAVIRREVVHRLDGAVRDAITAVMPSRIVVAATGGFPVVTNLVEEIVRLHASVPVDVLEVADGTMAVPPTADRAVARVAVPEPLASFQARRRALELTERGNLLGAWAVAEPLHADEVEHRWTQVMEWLAHFASSLPIREDCDISILSHPHMAVRAALRVELALRAGNLPRAVHGTVAFLESALWDNLLEHFERDPRDARRLKLRDGRTAPTGKLLRDGGDDDKNRPFESKQGSDGQPWFCFHESGAGRFARDYVKSRALKQLLDAVDRVRELRNDVAHNEPTPELMEDARYRMRDAQLWSADDTFLSQPLVQKVLKKLGESAPQLLLSKLLAEIRRRLVAPFPPTENNPRGN
jgi:hypothetical protein